MPRKYEGLNVESDFEGQFPWKSHRIDVGGGIRRQTRSFGEMWR